MHKLILSLTAVVVACGGDDGPERSVAVTVDPVRVLADGRSEATVTVHVTDTAGAASEVAVELAASGQVVFSKSEAVTDDEGVVVSTVTSITGETMTITASVDGGSGEAPVTFVGVPAPCAGELQLPGAPMIESGGVSRVADFDGDGNQDLLGLAFNQSGAARMALGRGDGTFEVGIDMVIPGTPMVGLVDGDTVPDLVTTDPGNADVMVFLGVGDGTFETPLRFPVTGAQFSNVLAVGDFDGDDNLDVGVAVSSTVFVFHGNGDGTLNAQVATGITVSEFARTAAAADFNEDGVDDLVVAGNDATGKLVLGQLDRTFGPVTDVALGALARDLLTTSFGGHRALVFVTSGFSVHVVQGNGDGTFDPARSLTLDAQPIGLAIGDLDGDNLDDLLVGTGISRLRFVLAHGNGDGTFDDPTPLPGGEQLGQVARLADFNKDGDLDLAVDVGPYTSVLLAEAGHFGPVTSQLATGLEFFNSHLTVDLDRDGRSDVVASAGSLQGGTAFLSWRNEGLAAFGAPTLISTGGLIVTTFAAGDVDRDGDPDIVALTEDARLHVFVNDAGVMTELATLPTADADTSNLGITLSDVDGDDRLDLAIPIQVTTPSFEVGIDIYPGDGHGSFGAPVRTMLVNGDVALTILFADLSGDGLKDVVFHAQSGPLKIRRGVGDGTFDSEVAVSSNQSYLRAAIGDIDNDGTPDLVATSIGELAIDVFLGTGAGAFTLPTTSIPFSGLGNRLRLADLDRDGNLDVAGAFTVAFGTGDGMFGRPRGYPMYSAIDDLDGDGLLDVIYDDRVGRQLACP